MSNRIDSFTVVLEGDMREEAAEKIAAAIRQLRGVLSVDLNVADVLANHIAERRVRAELGDQLLAVVYPPKP